MIPIVTIPQAVSAVATFETDEEAAEDYTSYNTASGKRCCNLGQSLRVGNRLLGGYNTASGKRCCNLELLQKSRTRMYRGYNTASGKRCCNFKKNAENFEEYSYNTASGKRCCNFKVYLITRNQEECYNTASGKRCCNSGF